ncbi:MAG: ABC transporter ATP-binding protein [Pseudomonadales bacterium]|jgi:NitT/TauT family transport system ATP-binding protein|nr:ABC transporter ATP-binding protein [Pseudomonadales bacterium]
MNASAELALHEVSKEYLSANGTVQALRDVSLSIVRGEFVAIIGASGCGKTTLLRLLAGLIAPTRGEVKVREHSLWHSGKRDTGAAEMIGMVFQDANLFPWYTVEENIYLPLMLQGATRQQCLEKARELCHLVGLAGFERSHTAELSGGMRQRVAIARALCLKPSILLMDEPFGSLDAMTRERMNLELQTMIATINATVVLVTHSITEAVFLADRVVALSPRPGEIRAIQPIEFPRERKLEVQADPRFNLAVQALRQALCVEGEK